MVLGLARQAVAAVVMAWGVRQTVGWVGTVDHTSLGAALRLGGLLAAAGVLTLIMNGTDFPFSTPTIEDHAGGLRILDMRFSYGPEEANRLLAKHEARLQALGRQVGEASGLAGQAKANLDLFQSQYDAGQRQVMDVVGVYETWVGQEVARIDLKYETAATRLEIVSELGLLADGSDI